jgi:hypothetical protein
MICNTPLHGGARLRGRYRSQRPGFILPESPIALAVLALVTFASSARAASNNGSNDAIQGTSSAAARASAVQSIPFDKLDAASRSKINTVLNNASIYRRMPTRTVNCDPDLYLFLVRHPDVVVNIWEILGVAQMQLRQTDVDSFHINEAEGTAASMEYLYHSSNQQIIYGKWTYTGPLLARKINGHCLAMLRSSYVKEANGKYYITAQMDGFISIESGGAELIARTLQPLMVKNVDNNFIQTVAFLGSLSKTAEVNPQGMVRLADRLTHVQPATRQQLGDVVNSVAQRSTATAANAAGPASRMASRPQHASSQ